MNVGAARYVQQQDVRTVYSILILIGMHSEFFVLCALREITPCTDGT
jgi:hypothetical protein